MELVTFARCAKYDAGLRSALEKVLVPQFRRHSVSGARIMLKPNLLAWRRPEDPACIHPALLTECVRLLHDAGAAHVAIVENPAAQRSSAVLREMGIDATMRTLGVEIRDQLEFARVTMPEQASFHQIELAVDDREFDLIFNLAKAKTHAMMTLTLNVKNLFGLIAGSERLGWHLSAGRNFDRFADLLLDLDLHYAPQINLLDAVTGMEGNGPGSGDPVGLGFLAAGSSAVALDAAVAPLLGVCDMPTLRRARERGLLPEFEQTGEIPDIREIRLPDPPSPNSDLGVWLPIPLRRMLRKAVVSRPKLEPSRCVGCGICEKMCPPHSLRLENGRPKFQFNECIRCYCCQEHCPQGAIRTEQTLAARLCFLAERLLRRILSLRGAGYAVRKRR